jgi:hypothetical protein
MFMFSPALGAVPLDAGALLELHMSVNQPAIAAEGLDAQEARAYFVSGHGPEGISAYVYLHMLSSQRALVYEWDAPIDKSEYPEIQAAVQQFTESMGFMMDDLQIRRRAPADRDRVIAELPIFAPLVPAAPEAPGAAPAEADDVVDLDAQGPVMLTGDESIYELVEPPASTQVAYEAAPAAPGAGDESPLEDKNFKVFLRLLTSV